MLVEVKHVLDASQAYDLEGAEAESHEDAESIVDSVVVGDSAGDGEGAAGESRPEEGGTTTPPCGDENPKDTTDSTVLMSVCLPRLVGDLHHEDVQVTRFVDFGGRLVPFQTLGHDQRNTCSRAVVTQTGRDRQDNKKSMLLSRRPVERVVRVVGGLGNKNRVAIRCELQVAIHIPNMSIDNDVIADVLLLVQLDHLHGVVQDAGFFVS